MTGWKRYIVVWGGVVIAAAACVRFIPYMFSSRGVIGPTLLQAQSPIAACVALVVGLAAATILGAVVGRLTNAVMGLFVIGFGLGMLALRFGSIRDLAFAGGSLPLLAVETVLWAGAVLGSTLVVFWIAGPLGDFVTDEENEPASSRWSLGGAAAGIVMLPVVWLMARSELRGQTIAATVLGGLVAGMLARLLSPHTQPRLIFATACLAGAVGHVIGAVVIQVSADGSMAAAYVASTLPAVSLPLPIDYAVGSLIGVAMGLGCAASFLHHEQEGEAAPSTASSKQ
jgi:hypothetical protein